MTVFAPSFSKSDGMHAPPRTTTRWDIIWHSDTFGRKCNGPAGLRGGGARGIVVNPTSHIGDYQI